MPELCAHHRPIASCPDGCATDAKDRNAGWYYGADGVTVRVPEHDGMLGVERTVTIEDIRDRRVTDVLELELQRLATIARRQLSTAWLAGLAPGSRLRLEVRITHEAPLTTTKGESDG